MSGSTRHHLLLHDDEILLILEALGQYEPSGPDSVERRGKSEQLARLIQKGTGVSVHPFAESNRTPVRTRLDETG